MVPGMGTWQTSDTVWQAIKDKVSLSICPPTEEKEQMLECLLPDKDVPIGSSEVLEAMEDPEDMTKEDQRILITELFELLEVAHIQNWPQHVAC